MTSDDRLAEARRALAEAERAAASGEGFLAAERERAERTHEVQRGVRSAASAAAREERRARRAARREHQGAGRSSGATGSDLFAPERAAAADRIDADRRRRGLAPSAGGPADTADADPRVGALESGHSEPGRTPRREKRSPFDAPPDDPSAVPDAHEVARQIVLRQLAMTARSRAQLESKLAERGCPPQVAAQVLDRMQEVGLVDDEAYAGMLVRSQVATRGLSRRGLAYELRKKGIDADLAEQALDQVAPDDERQTARALVDKKMRTMAGLDKDVKTRRLAGMLARKGYSAGLAYAVIREALAELPEHARD